MGGAATRKGLHKRHKCRKQFTVRQGTLFESSHVPLHVWLQAIYLIAGSKKGISSHQPSRTLGLTVKTAWFLSHRIREAMREGDLAPFGQGGGAVEVDETYIGRRRASPSVARITTRWPCSVWLTVRADALALPSGAGIGPQHSADRS